MKVLMLILASDGGAQDIYTRVQNDCWRKYMHSCPDKIEAYFYKANPHQVEEFYIEGDTVYVKAEEKYPFLWKKFCQVLRAFQHRFHEFDFICRPNSSCFIILDRYINLLEKYPREKCCLGSLWFMTGDDFYFPGGHFIITIDIAKFVIKNSDKSHLTQIDDYNMGIILKEMEVHITQIKFISVYNTGDIYNMIKSFDDDECSIYYTRNSSSNNRAEDDMIIFDLLLNKFYPHLL
jgi:Galactosyltransferase